MRLFRNLVIAKSNLQYVEAEKIVLACIPTGEIPDWIGKNNLHFALLGKNFVSDKNSLIVQNFLLFRLSMEYLNANIPGNLVPFASLYPTVPVIT